MAAGDVHELDDQTLVRALRALGAATRFRMVQEVAASRELCCGQVAERFDVTQPTISHHLKVLRDAGLVESTRRGTWAYYRLVPDAVRELRNTLGG
jgi:ArsR family transcriptional regulator, arsenate/arsenite/antimonite-responsive transcriptional repressor